MGAKPIKRCSFKKDGIKFYLRIQRTGDKMPQPARIVMDKEFWDSTTFGGSGWDTVTAYDKTFDDWNVAYATYDRMLKEADANSIKEM